jgi:hypothetical protein
MAPLSNFCLVHRDIKGKLMAITMPEMVTRLWLSPKSNNDLTARKIGESDGHDIGLFKRKSFATARVLNFQGFQLKSMLGFIH